MIECIFGWGKQHGTMRKTKHRRVGRVAADFLLNLIAYNLIRIPKLIVALAPKSWSDRAIPSKRQADAALEDERMGQFPSFSADC
jgi:hypothetical protein